jgi:RHS repeat-associated protein
MFKRSVVVLALTVGMLVGSGTALAAPTPPVLSPPAATSATTAPASDVPVVASAEQGGRVEPAAVMDPVSAARVTAANVVAAAKAKGAPPAEFVKERTDQPLRERPEPKDAKVGKGGGRVKPVKGKKSEVPGGLVNVKLDDEGSDLEAPELNVVVLDENETAAMGGNKLAVKVDRVDPGEADAPLELALSYDSFRDAYGGDWATRVRVVLFPECAGQKVCDEVPVEVPSENDPVAGVVKAKIKLRGKKGPSLGKAALPMVIGNSSGGVYGISSGAGGSAGQWSASPLGRTGSWAVGTQSGAFTWSYPISMPPATGPAPSVALSYNSQAVDGMTTATNNQGGQIAPGWELSAGGFIERGFEPCPNDPDLCQIPNWRGWTLNLNGRSSEILPTAVAGQWKLKNDPGWFVLHRPLDGWGGGTGVGSPSSDNDRETFELHSPDGMVYFFGTAPATQNSVWAVPVNSACQGQPSKQCYQGWRFMLDRVVDPAGNVTLYSYTTELNEYYSTDAAIRALPKVGGNPPNSNMIDYVRGGYLSRIDYGGNGAGFTAGNGPASVVFNYENRCVALNASCDTRAPETYHVEYPDAPTDLYCKFGITCSNSSAIRAPSFFSLKVLRNIQTYAGPTAVDTFQLSHEFPGVETTSTGLTSRLWLRYLQRIPANSVGAAPSPKVSFQSNQNLPNRGDNATVKMNYPRLNLVRDELGGETRAEYGRPHLCDHNGLVGFHDDYVGHPRDCYLAYLKEPGSTTYGWAAMNKYMVIKTLEVAKAGDPDSKSIYTTYAYNDAPAWRYTENIYSTAGVPQQPSDFRGHGDVTVTVGAPGQVQTKTRHLYFRGMNGDTCSLLNTSNCTVASDTVRRRDVAVGDIAPGPTTPLLYDNPEFAGKLISSSTLDASNGDTMMFHTWHGYGLLKTATYVEVRPVAPPGATWHATTDIYNTVETKTTTWRKTNSAWTYRDITTDYNSYGLVAAIKESNVGWGGQDRCTTFNLWPAPSTSVGAPTFQDGVPWFMGLSVSDTVFASANCDATTAVARTDRNFDNAGPGATGAVSKGQVKRTISYQTSSIGVYTYFDYDTVGRLVRQTVPMANSGFTWATPSPATYTTTTFTPAGAGLTTSIVSANPLNFTTTMTFDTRWGVPLSSTDPAGATTTAAYDGLGRRIRVDLPNTPDSPTSQDFLYSYDLPLATAIPDVITAGEGAGGASITLKQNQNGKDANAGGVFLESTEYLDGLGRTKETQKKTGTGRSISQTFFDSRGLKVREIAPFGTGPLVTAGSVAAPAGTAETNTIYDSLARPTSITTTAANTAPATTTMSYSPNWVTTVQPPTGTATATFSDQDGHPLQVIETKFVNGIATPQTTNYLYDALGNLLKVVDPKNRATTYTYNWAGQRVSTSDPDKGASTMAYTTSSDGGSTETFNQTGSRYSRVTYTDLLGRVSARHNLLDGQYLSTLEDFTYKRGPGAGIGQLDTAKSCDPIAAACLDPITTRNDTYDVRGRLTSKTYGISGTYLKGNDAAYTFTYGYDNANERTVVNYPAITSNGITVSPAEAVTTSYDAGGSPTTVTSPTQTYVAGAQYRNDGRLLKRSLGTTTGGLDRSIDYDGFGRVKTLAAAWKGASIQNDALAYDTRSNITSIRENAGPSAGQQQCFLYDEGNRLQDAWTQATTTACGTTPTPGAAGLNPYTMSYTYDIDGTMKSMTNGTTVINQTFGDLNHPHAVTMSGTSTFEYNSPSGNMTKRTVNGKTQNLYYGYDDRLRYLWDNGQRTDYRYDANGQRIVAATNAGSTIYLDGLIELNVKPASFGETATLLANVTAYDIGDGDTDRRADLIAVNPGNITVRVSDPGLSALLPPTVWSQVGEVAGVKILVGDVNGDTMADIVTIYRSGSVYIRLSTGSAFTAPSPMNLGTLPAQPTVLLGDVTGDRLADLVFVGQSSGVQGISVMASNGNTFKPAVSWSALAPYGSSPTLADVNGDWRMDIVDTNGLNGAITVQLANATGTGFGGYVNFGASTGPMQTADMNGDFKADLINPTGQTVRLSNGTNFGPAQTWSTTPLTWSVMYQTGPQGLLVGSLLDNGLGSDVVGGSNDTGVTVKLSNGTSLISATGNSFRDTPPITVKRYYTHGATTVATSDTKNGLHWLVNDQQGTTGLDIAATGTGTVTRQQYKPFGQQRGGDTLTNTDHGFLGQIEDPTGLTYLNARYYDPTTARFISVDPIVSVTHDAYGYAGNNPISFSDPTGLIPDGGRDWKDHPASGISGVPGPTIPDAVVAATNSLLNLAGSAVNGSTGVDENQALNIMVHLWESSSAGATGSCGFELFDCVPFALSGHCEGAEGQSAQTVCSYYGGFNYGNSSSDLNLMVTGSIDLAMMAFIPKLSLAGGGGFEKGALPAGYRGASGYNDTSRGKKFRNIETNVRGADFERTLEENGYVKSYSGDGKVRFYEKDGAVYGVRDSSKTDPGHPTAEFTPAGAGEKTVKIRLEP